MAFCEQCGARLALGTRFCEECGAAIASEAHDAVVADVVCGAPDAKDIFRSLGWEESWRRIASDAGDCELELIVTRENALLSQIDASATALHTLNADYVDSAAKHMFWDHHTKPDERLDSWQELIPAIETKLKV